MRSFIAATVCLLFFACAGGYVEGVSQKSEKGFLKFVGNTQFATVSIDGKPAFSLAEDKEKDVVYEVKPGNRQVRVFRNNQLVVDRNVFVDNQATMEINIP
ncbi:MAG: hypothetical protein WEB37_10280 [Bacteroidota bacterium]